MSLTSQAWKKAWNLKAFRSQFIVSLLVLASFAWIFNWFFDFAEGRTGTKLQDPFLELLPVRNVSWTVFFFLYMGILIALYCNWSKPKLLLLALQTYVLVTLLRVVAITLVPLEPPDGYLPLREPIVQFFTNGGRIISKDLFFSGHVSTICSMFFAVQSKRWKPVLGMFVVMVSFLVLLQHVHYTIDVVFAPFATWLCFLFNKKILNSRIPLID